MNRFKQIFEAYVNLLKKKAQILPEDILKLSEQRMTLCKGCPFFAHSVSICNVCGCYMPAKTKVLEASCPEEKWGPIYEGEEGRIQ